MWIKGAVGSLRGGDVGVIDQCLASYPERQNDRAVASLR
jgi:hypothetical protein